MAWRQALDRQQAHAATVLATQPVQVDIEIDDPPRDTGIGPREHVASAVAAFEFAQVKLGIGQVEDMVPAQSLPGVFRRPGHGRESQRAGHGNGLATGKPDRFAADGREQPLCQFHRAGFAMAAANDQEFLATPA